MRTRAIRAVLAAVVALAPALLFAQPAQADHTSAVITVEGCSDGIGGFGTLQVSIDGETAPIDIGDGSGFGTSKVTDADPQANIVVQIPDSVAPGDFLAVECSLFPGEFHVIEFDTANNAKNDTCQSPAAVQGPYVGQENNQGNQHCVTLISKGGVNALSAGGVDVAGGRFAEALFGEGNTLPAPVQSMPVTDAPGTSMVGIATDSPWFVVQLLGAGLVVIAFGVFTYRRRFATVS